MVLEIGTAMYALPGDGLSGRHGQRVMLCAGSDPDASVPKN